MKNIYFLALLCCSIFITSCQKEDTPAPDPTPTPAVAKYTVMLYGCAGGNLDPYLDKNLKEALSYGSTDKVKMTAMVKYSAEYQNDTKKSGTRRFTIAKNEMQNLSVEKVTYPLYDPSSIADFISWSKTIAPAENYILVLWNHGGGWDPAGDPKSRAIIYDDNLNNRPMSLNEVIAGVKLSNTHMAMVYYDACLMNMLENFSGMVEVSDYILGAEHLTPGDGGNYTTLLKELNSDASLEAAMTRYTKSLVAEWNLGSSINKHDISLTNLKKITPVLTQLNKISKELKATYAQYKTAYNKAADISYYPDPDCQYYDVVDYVSALAKESKNPVLTTYATELKVVAKQALVCCDRTVGLGNQEIFWSVTLVNKDLWMSKNYGNGSYQSTAFDVATGWSEWLKINESKPISRVTNDDDGHNHGN